MFEQTILRIEERVNRNILTLEIGEQQSRERLASDQPARDENPDIAGKYQVMSIPTLMFFKEGKPVDKIIGVAPKKQFKDKIDTLLG